MSRTDFSPLSLFFLSTQPAEAAARLTDKHITSQCRALSRVTVQIARIVGLDLTGFSRKDGVYDDNGDSTMAMWACETRRNHLWFQLYAQAVYAEYRTRFGQERFDDDKRDSPDHACKGRCEWVWTAMEQQGRTVTADGELTAPPIPQLGDDAQTCPPGAAKVSRRLYEKIPVVLDDLEMLLDNLSWRAQQADWKPSWLGALLDRPEDALAKLPDDLLVRAFCEALQHGATRQQLGDALFAHRSSASGNRSATTGDRSHTPLRRQRAA